MCQPAKKYKKKYGKLPAKNAEEVILQNRVNVDQWGIYYHKQQEGLETENSTVNNKNVQQEGLQTENAPNDND